MADQRDLHDIEQVFEGAFRRDESPGQTVPAVNKFRSGSSQLCANWVQMSPTMHDAQRQVINDDLLANSEQEPSGE
jgi:hypothetical protein